MSNSNDELAEMINKTAKFVKQNITTPENKAKLMSLGRIAMNVGINIKDQIADNFDLDDFDLSDIKNDKRKNVNIDDILDKLNKR